MTKDQEKLLNKTAENANENTEETNENSTSGQFNLKIKCIDVILINKILFNLSKLNIP